MEDMFKMFSNTGMDTNAVFDMFVATMLRQMKVQANELECLLDELIKNSAKKKRMTVDGTQTFNPFDVLGVPPTATEEEVRKAYKKKANEAHPDKGGDVKSMQMINIAFELICKFRGWRK